MSVALDPKDSMTGGPVVLASTPRREPDRLFPGLLALSMLLCLAVASLLTTVDLTPRILRQEAARRATLVMIAPEPEPVLTATIPVVSEIPVVEDLTSMPELAQEITAPAEAPPEPEVAAADPEPAPPTRRVYGLRKVYARGLGSGAGAGAIVGKLGNTLNTEPDEIQATAEDLTGQLAPLSTVSSPPVLKERARPVYSEAMLEARAEGTVRARLLVDVDGRVKAVDMLADIGFDSREVASRAFQSLRFEPALRGEEPVAVWIIMTYRFELQE